MRMIAGQNKTVQFGFEWLELVVLNKWFLSVILLEIMAFLAWLKILETQNLSIAFPISSISYVAILIAGKLIFHEDISLTQILGSGLIIAGCWLIGTASKSPIEN